MIKSGLEKMDGWIPTNNYYQKLKEFHETRVHMHTFTRPLCLLATTSYHLPSNILPPHSFSPTFYCYVSVNPSLQFPPKRNTSIICNHHHNDAGIFPFKSKLPMPTLPLQNPAKIYFTDRNCNPSNPFVISISFPHTHTHE